jgi:hypothetical protein
MSAPPTYEDLLDLLRLLLALTELVAPEDILGPQSSFMAEVRTAVATAAAPH